MGSSYTIISNTGTLAADGRGGYLLTEADGTATDYNPNGTLNYIQGDCTVNYAPNSTCLR